MAYMIPSVVLMVPLLVILRRYGLVNTYPGLILAEATNEAIAATGRPDAVQTKYTRSEARDEADARNYGIQATIGTKEGVAEGIRQLVGSAITDHVLKNVDGSPKTVDE